MLQLVTWEPITRQATASGMYLRKDGSIAGGTRCSGARTIERYVPECIEGAYVVDKSPMIPEGATWDGGFAALAYASPMHNYEVPEGCTVGWDRQPKAVNVAALLEGVPRTPGDVALALPGWALAYVSADVYADIYRHAGARIGRVFGGVIQWEDEE